MEIKTQNTLIGTGAGAAVGTVAGAAAGVVVGNKKAAATLAKKGIQAGQTAEQFRVASLKNFMKSDEYASKVKALKGANKKAKVAISAQLQTIKENISKKALETFSSTTKLAKNTKVKWIAGITAAGLAAGALIGGIVGRISANKADK